MRTPDQMFARERALNHLCHLLQQEGTEEADELSYIVMGLLESNSRDIARWEDQQDESGDDSRN